MKNWQTTWLPGLVLLLWWAELVRQLSFHWSTNPQYAFGWSVPFLTGMLVWEAWVTRPQPKLCAVPAWGWALVTGMVFLLLPARLFFEATPDWRFPVWVTAAVVISLSLVAVYRSGGWPWLKHFGVPILFFLVSVPWPVKVELPLIDTLTRWVATLTVHGLNLTGTPAVCRGNLIEVSTGVVGIEEACSGIRSFQAALMASLFLGQFFLLRWPSRVILLITGAILAFACNAVRASTLTIIADRRGLDAIHTWHDSAGYGILLVCFGLLFVLARLLRPSEGAPAPSRNVAPPHPLPAAFRWGLAGWLAFVMLGTEAWYRSAIPDAATWWRVEWPRNEPEFAELDLAEIQPAMLADDARAARWHEGSGRQYTMYFFRWLPGPAASRMLARFHRPEICMTAAGTKLVEETAPELVQQGDLSLRFRTYLFEQRGQHLWVFFCVWEDQKPLEGDGAVMESWTPATRWQAVTLKRRKLGQQVLEIGMSGKGKEDEEAARADFRRVIVPLLHPDQRAKIGAAP